MRELNAPRRSHPFTQSFVIARTPASTTETGIFFRDHIGVFGNLCLKEGDFFKREKHRIAFLLHDTSDLKIRERSDRFSGRLHHQE
jgi:hypothetical protein